MQAAIEEKANIWFGTPTMFVDFLNQPNAEDLDFSKFPIRGIMGTVHTMRLSLSEVNLVLEIVMIIMLVNP